MTWSRKPKEAVPPRTHHGKKRNADDAGEAQGGGPAVPSEARARTTRAEGTSEPARGRLTTGRKETPTTRAKPKEGATGMVA